MMLSCSICHRKEIASNHDGSKSFPTSKAHAIEKKRTKAFICSRCLSICLQKKFVNLPWTSEDFLRPFMKRRVVRKLTRRKSN